MKNICFLVLLLSLSAFAQDIVLVRNGIPEAEIVLGKKPSRAAQMAAFELVHVIRLITGAELPIAAEGGGKMLPIRIGNAEKGEFKGEEYLVSVSSEGIRLAGHDTEDCGKVDYRNYKTFPGVSYHYETPRQIYNYHSTLYAVYDFLEILCGVRFYSFGDLGIACAKRKTLAVRALERRYEPKTDAFRYAGFVFRDGKGNPLRDQRLLQLRWRMNTLFGQVNHMTDSLIWRYWGPAKGYEKVFIEKRPEYFTQGYDPMPPGDSRTLYPADNPPPPQICTSHPDVARYFAREAFEVMKGKAFATPPLEGVRFRFMKKMEGKPFYYPVQEGDNSYWCKCENCRKLFPQFKGARHHAYLHFDFVNRVAREAGKLDPELHIATLAYNMALEYPDPRILRLDPGIAVQLCLGIHSWMHPSVYRRQHGEYLKWVRNERDKRPLFVWTYILSPESEAYKSYRYYNFFPVRFPKPGKVAVVGIDAVDLNQGCTIAGQSGRDKRVINIGSRIQIHTGNLDRDIVICRKKFGNRLNHNATRIRNDGIAKSNLLIAFVGFLSSYTQLLQRIIILINRRYFHRNRQRVGIEEMDPKGRLGIQLLVM